MHEKKARSAIMHSFLCITIGKKKMDPVSSTINDKRNIKEHLYCMFLTALQDKVRLQTKVLREYK